MKRIIVFLIKIIFKQLVALAVVLMAVNWLSSAGSLRRPLGLFQCDYIHEKMVALYLLGTYTAGHFWCVPDREEVDSLIDAASRKYQVERSLIYALIEVESSWRFYAVSPRGACGYTQLLVPTAKALRVERTQIFDPAQNIDAGTRYLKMLLTQFKGDVWMALAAYNWGPTYMGRAGHNFTPAMERYIAKILKARARYSINKIMPEKAGRRERKL
jgi:hypothetical protein